MGGSGSSSSSGKTEIRYAAYIEAAHSYFLTTLQTARNEKLNKSPFKDYVDIDVDSAFFGVGFLLSSFPSLYDMYGKFMAGLDIEALYSQLYEDTVNSPITNNLIAAEGALIDEEININSIPRFQTGMRDINSVVSSNFVVGKALIEDARTKSISKFSAELKYRLIPIAQERWSKHLEWNRTIIATYMDVMKLYYVVKSDVNDQNYEMHEKDALWKFTVLEFERAGLGALQGATTTKTTPKGSKLAGALGGAASGAMAGSMVMPGLGTAIGAIVGGIGGYMSS